MVPGRPGVSGLPGQAALATRLCLPCVWMSAVLAHRGRAVDVSAVRAQDVGDRGHDLPPHADAVVHVVCGDLVCDLAEERDVGLGPATGSGVASYETAWAWSHKLRRAMVRPDRDLLAGIVEVDETMVGGVTPGRFGGASGKVPVMIAVEHNDGRRLGRVRMAVARRPGSLDLVEFAASVVEPGSTIRTDGARTLNHLADMGYIHEATVVYSATDKASVLPGVHLVASLLKRWFIGTLHYRVEEQQLPYYLDEYTFRFNRRTSKSRAPLFYRLLQQAVRTDPHPLDTLLKPDQSL